MAAGALLVDGAPSCREGRAVLSEVVGLGNAEFGAIGVDQLADQSHGGGGEAPQRRVGDRRLFLECVLDRPREQVSPLFRAARGGSAFGSQEALATWLNRSGKARLLAQLDSLHE